MPVQPGLQVQPRQRSGVDTSEAPRQALAPAGQAATPTSLANRQSSKHHNKEAGQRKRPPLPRAGSIPLLGGAGWGRAADKKRHRDARGCARRGPLTSGADSLWCRCEKMVLVEKHENTTSSTCLLSCPLPSITMADPRLRPLKIKTGVLKR